jgi:hypothetical protein
MGVENKDENMVSKLATGFMSITLGTLFGIFRGLGGVVGIGSVASRGGGAYKGLQKRATA